MDGEVEPPCRHERWGALKDCLAAVRRSVSVRLNGQHSPADLVQEAYARLLNRPDNETFSNPAGYLYRTALHIAYNASAREGVETRVHRELSLSQPEVSEALDPARIYASREQLARVTAAIEALPPRCREVFLLYRFEGLDQATIASRLAISRNMVEKHVIRAMRACRAALHEIS